MDRPDPTILCFKHQNFLKEQDNSPEETKALSDKVENLQDSLAVEKETFLNLQAKVLFLEMMQNFNEEEGENFAAGELSEVDHQKRLLKELKGENRATQEEISTLITQLAETHATYEQKKNDFSKRALNNNDMEVDENAPQNVDPKPSTPVFSANDPPVASPVPPNNSDRLRQVSSQSTDDLSALRVILEKMSGVTVDPILPNSALSLQTHPPAFPSLHITIHLSNTTQLKSVSIEPPSPVPYADLVQYTVALGGDIQFFLGEYLTRLVVK
eukprot:CAMPEP_0201507814 /NCGR_PEP_ID=MMETSP0161_2-20130828/1365_1 /ASSEMBLY_ACC=CAM_ASM_000251 /TAXON_ID=180227 /ORGANISM="Neoparamoeba aestuarina, Strain SoJaBio B1-5/56/2" /LENGTH=270 /DNA_ID=CAMNT_0047902285 /DNA_START=6 /DNA_END=818 /DNA_ORIENTATION=-